MARIIASGFTTTGVARQMNEDSFAFQNTIYPNSLSGYEHASVEASSYIQSYNITNGFGGSGIGDIAGRVVQRIVQNESESLREVERSANHFPRWASNTAKLCQRGVAQQLERYGSLPVGCTHAGVFVVNNTAYFMSNGGNVLMLARDGELYTLGEQDVDENGRPNSYFGYQSLMGAEYPSNLNCIDLEAGDVIIMASLGAVASLSPSELQNQLDSRTSMATFLRSVYRTGLMKHVSHNQTMVTLEVVSLEVEKPLELPRLGKEKQGQAVYTEISDNTQIVSRQTKPPKNQMISPFGDLVDLIPDEKLRQLKDTRRRDQMLLTVCGVIVLILFIILIWPLLH